MSSIKSKKLTTVCHLTNRLYFLWSTLLWTIKNDGAKCLKLKRNSSDHRLFKKLCCRKRVREKLRRLNTFLISATRGKCKPWLLHGKQIRTGQFQAVTQRMELERNLAAQMTHLVTSYCLRPLHTVASWQALGKMPL